MLEREVFASFHILQRGWYPSPQFKVGASVSLITHILLVIAVYSLSFRPNASQDVHAGTEEGREIPPGEIVEVSQAPLIMPPPEVIRQLLGETRSAEPARPDFIAERSSIARGEPNPHPRGSSRLPRSSGEGSELPASAASREKPSPAKSEPEVVESRDRLPTVASQPTPSRREKPSPGAQLPDPGEGPDIAKLGSTTRELPITIENQDSAVTVRGPISVNARGVGAIEEYRAYLERAIQERWQIPPEANLLTRSTSLTVEFAIAKDGRLLSIRPYNSTGIRALDRAALRAIELAAPFRPLPDIFPNPSQLFTDTFVYYPPQ